MVNVGHGRAEIARGHGGAGRPPRLRPRQRVHDRAARGVRRARSARTCPWTMRRSTRCRAARRRSRPRSRWPVRITSRAARPTAGSSSRDGAAITATPWARSTSPAGGRSAAPTRAGSAGSATSRRPIRTAPDARSEGARRRRGARRGAGAGIEAAGPGTVAAFVAEPIVGATLAAAVPPDGYWPAIAEVCRRHGVLLIADEVMTGFGRTGRWFGVDHWGVRPDILVAAKGATSGYWPFGFVAAAGHVHDTVTGPGRSSTASPTRTPGRGGRGARGAADPRDEALVGRARSRATGCGRCSACGSASTQRRGGARPGPDGRHRAGRGPGDARPFPRSRAGHRGGRGRGPRTRRPGLLGNGQGQRGGRRPDPARAAVRHHRRRARADRRRARRRHRGHDSRRSPNSASPG